MILKLNEPENNLQLIQIGEGYVVVDSRPLKGIHPEVTYFDDKVNENNIYKSTEMFTNRISFLYIKGISENKRTVHTILFTSQSFSLEGVSVIEESNKLDEILEPFILDNGDLYCHNTPFLIKKIKEVLQAKENTYTEEQLKEVIDRARNYNDGWVENEKEIIESLNQPKVEITFDENNQP